MLKNAQPSARKYIYRQCIYTNHRYMLQFDVQYDRRVDGGVATLADEMCSN